MIGAVSGGCTSCCLLGIGSSDHAGLSNSAVGAILFFIIIIQIPKSNAVIIFVKNNFIRHISHIAEIVIVEESCVTLSRIDVALYVSAACMQKFMWCMALFQILNILSSCEVNVEFFIFEDVMM